MTTDQVGPSTQEVSEPFFKSLRREKYRFVNDDAKRRYWNGTNKTSGAIILWDLVNALGELGYNIVDDLVPRSVYEPDMLRQPLTRFEQGGIMGDFDRVAFNKAFNRVRKMFKTKGPKLTPIPLEECEFEGNKNSGAPHFARKEDVHQEALNEAYAIRRGMSPPPVVVFHRGKDEEVARPVFGYPFSMTLLETRFFQPYQDRLLQTPGCPYVGGKYDFQVAGLINELRSKSRWMLELDFRGLDGSASAFLISKASQIVRENFDLDEFDAYDWDVVIRYLLFASILAPDECIYHGIKHGIKSGSKWTQVFDTIITLLGVFYVKYKRDIDITRVYGLGDDSESGINGPAPNLTEWQADLLELGLVLNEKKSRVKSTRDKPYFLGHLWHKLHAVRPTLETLVRLCTPERNRKEYWMKEENPQAYVQALVERILRYQEDNPDTWDILQRLLQKVLFPHLDKRFFIAASDSNLFFSPVKESIERDRWRYLPVAANDRKRPPGAYRVLSDWY